jgi:hypothetical protein
MRRIVLALVSCFAIGSLAASAQTTPAHRPAAKKHSVKGRKAKKVKRTSARRRAAAHHA